jgi:hypothetical protein
MAFGHLVLEGISVPGFGSIVQLLPPPMWWDTPLHQYPLLSAIVFVSYTDPDDCPCMVKQHDRIGITSDRA